MAHALEFGDLIIEQKIPGTGYKEKGMGIGYRV